MPSKLRRRAAPALLGLSMLALLPEAARAAGYSVSSPGGKIVVTVQLGANGAPSYGVAKAGGQVLVESSPMGLVTNLGDFSSGLALVSRSDAAISGAYTLPGHKKTAYDPAANQMTLRFARAGKEFDIVVRACDDGFAFRYVVPGSGTLTTLADKSAFNLLDSASGWAQGYVTSYEGIYNASANFNSGSFGMPVLARQGSDWLLLSESAVDASFYASHLAGGAGNVLTIAAPDSSAASSALPFQGPWRLAIVGSLDTIVRSTMVENLDGPPQVADTSWIRPGRAAWSWMSGDPQSAYATHTPYVDLAASMGWEYYLADAGWQASWAPQLVSYAAARDVGVLLWTDVADVDTEAKAQAAFAQWAAWGVKGVKVDYFYDDGEATMQRYDMLARVAAQNRLVIYFHGATKPNGLMRRWPNILTQEAVAGAEQRSLPASHDVTLVFTRNVVGPMDYTPVDYSVITDGNSTWAHQTALALMFSSYLQHYSDRWATYRDSLAADLFRALPSVWDETRLIEGAPDQYATIARRGGNDWYVGAITGSGVARTASIPLNFLTPGVTYAARIYADGASSHDIAVSTQQVTSVSTLSLPLAANGGAAVRITTQAPVSTLPELAAGKAATADSACAPTEGADKAVNGSVANGLADKWCSGGASKWLEVDLGGTYNVSQLAVRHAGAGGEATSLNTRDFTLRLSADHVNWTTAASVAGNTAATTVHPIAPTSARWVRLEVATGAQPGQANVARIYALEAYGTGQVDTSAYYKLVNRGSGKVLAVQNAALGDAASILQWDYVDPTTNDEWRLVDVGGGYYDVVNHWSGKALDVQGAVVTDGAPLIQFASNGGANQQWQLQPTDSGYARLVSRNSGKVADVTGQSTANGALVVQASWSATASQQWQLVRLGSVVQPQAAAR